MQESILPDFKTFAVSIRPTGFLRFWYPYNIQKCNQTENDEFRFLFAMKSSFKFPASDTPNEVDRVMKDLWRMMSLQEPLKASCFYFAFFTTALFHQSRFVFFVDKNSLPLLKRQRTEPAVFGNSWLDITTHSETQTLVFTLTHGQLHWAWQKREL